jgi:hypothetical protein
VLDVVMSRTVLVPSLVSEQEPREDRPGEMGTKTLSNSKKNNSVSRLFNLMFLWKVSGSMESFGRAAAGSAATTKRRLQTRTSTTPPHYCHVLYVDRGVIVLNKPPGLVSQATAPSHDHDALSTTRTQARAAAPIVVDAAISRKNVNRRQVAAPPQSAVFDDVLYGRSQIVVWRPDWGKKTDFFFSTKCRVVIVELRRRYELSTNPYPVHRLDKVTKTHTHTHTHNH